MLAANDFVSVTIQDFPPDKQACALAQSTRHRTGGSKGGLVGACEEIFEGILGVSLQRWYPQNTSKWSFLVGKPMVVGETHHFRKPLAYILLFTQQSMLSSKKNASTSWVGQDHVYHLKEPCACVKNHEKQHIWKIVKKLGGFFLLKRPNPYVFCAFPRPNHEAESSTRERWFGAM